jgi:hypothetical protein
MNPNSAKNNLPTLLLLTAVLFGAWLRFTPALMAGFPVNDGGMFAIAIDAIIKNGFALPQTIAYNQLGIPFAYPPLPFYVAALLGGIFHIPTTALLMWIPAAVATLCIPVIYLLAHSLTTNPIKAALAALFYALLPGGAAWLVMGGGLTRGFGTLFLLLTVNSAYALFCADKKEHGWLAAVWGSLTVLSHPEMALHAAGLALALLLISHKKDNFLRALLVGAGVSALTSPWWGVSLYRFGLEPFIQASKLSGRDFLWIVQQLGFLQLTGEEIFPVIGVLGLLGFLVLFARKEYRLAILIVIPYIVNQRNAGTIAIVFLCTAAAIALVDLILPGLERWGGKRNAALTGFAVYVSMFVLLGAYLGVLKQTKAVVSTENRAALAWVNTNTPASSRFLVLTGNEHLFYDPTMEWFPALAQRQSIGTLQGREWQFGTVFYAEMSQIQAVQQCYFQDITCLEGKSNALAAYDYLYLTKTCAGQVTCNFPSGQSGPLDRFLRAADGKYQLVFDNQEAAIFAIQR